MQFLLFLPLILSIHGSNIAPELHTYPDPLFGCTLNPNDMILAHNLHREKHGSPQLLWSDNLAIEAQLMANFVVKNGCIHVHRNRRSENILIANRPLIPQDAVDNWYGKSYLMDFKTRTYPFPVSDPWSFPNMIWRDSRQVGCGRACCGTGKDVWVCEYFPPAFIEDFAYNVRPMKMNRDASILFEPKNLNGGVQSDGSVPKYLLQPADEGSESVITSSTSENDDTSESYGDLLERGRI